MAKLFARNESWIHMEHGQFAIYLLICLGSRISLRPHPAISQNNTCNLGIVLCDLPMVHINVIAYHGKHVPNDRFFAMESRPITFCCGWTRTTTNKVTTMRRLHGLSQLRVISHLVNSTAMYLCNRTKRHPVVLQRKRVA